MNTDLSVHFPIKELIFQAIWGRFFAKIMNNLMPCQKSLLFKKMALSGLTSNDSYEKAALKKM